MGRIGLRGIAWVGLAVMALAAGTAHPAADKAKAASACKPSAFRAIIDVGHTAEVGGVPSARGVPEYEFNLRLAKLIEQKLTEAGCARTLLLITKEPPTRGLFQRVMRANAAHAVLFLSIHHDVVPDAFVEKWEYEGRERAFSDRFRGHSIFISNDNRDRRGSLAFARLLGLALKAHGLVYTPHYTERFMGHRRRELVDREAGVYRYDQLVVLRHTLMPAVLLEAGSIVNRDEELLLATPEHESVIAESVVEAVEKFCALRRR